jgi:hypothetical protein
MMRPVPVFASRSMAPDTAMPKSSSFTAPDRAIRMFPGLMSRWTNRSGSRVVGEGVVSAACSAPATSPTISSATFTGSAPDSAITPERSVPSMYSVISAGRPSTVTRSYTCTIARWFSAASSRASSRRRSTEPGSIDASSSFTATSRDSPPLVVMRAR